MAHPVNVEVEYCDTAWGFKPRYLELAEMLSAQVPDANIQVSFANILQKLVKKSY